MAVKFDPILGKIREDDASPNSITLSDLAEPTAKGSLIVGDGATSPSEQTVGADNTVLTADSTQPRGVKWATPSAGASPYDCTVASSGADYTDVQAAIAAGKVNILITGDITEDSDVVPTTNYTSITIGPDVTWTTGDYNIDMTSITHLTLWGFDMNSSIISRARTTSAVDFIAGAAGDYVTGGNFTFNNSGSTQIQEFNHADVVINLENVWIKCANGNGGGLNITKPECIVNNIKLTGGGASSRGGLVAANGGIVKNLEIDGTWQGSQGCINIQDGGMVDGVIMSSSTNTAFLYVLGGSLYNVEDSVNMDVVVEANNSRLGNIECDNLNITATSQGSIISNVKCNTVTIGTSVKSAVFNNIAMVQAATWAGSDCVINGLYAQSTLTFSGSNNIVNGLASAGAVTLSGTGNQVQFLTEAAVTVTGDRNNITGQVGTDAGGGANTITFNAGADNNLVHDCYVDVAIVDNGSGNVFAGVIVY